MSHVFRCAASIAFVFPALLAAQTCEPSTSSNEAMMFASRSLGLAHARGPSLNGYAAGTITAGIEVAHFPHVAKKDATPDTCNPGKGPENANIVPGFARVRASVVLPARLILDASWLPPVKVKGLTGNVFGVSLRHRHGLTPTLSLDARAHAALGSVTGPITCGEAALENPNSECLDGTLSNDEFKPNILGADLAVAHAATGRAMSWYGGAGYSRLAPRFQVHFRNSGGLLDTTKVRVDLDRVALFGGAAWTIARRWTASAEVYATTADGATVRVFVDRVLRGRE
ncbi:MAG TPA: hypothetical protein VJR92_13500 [Gemmatimonadaceae bacterium]|nr:hypothetical protein [Gemmatimonadaceae bacterium]